MSTPTPKTHSGISVRKATIPYNRSKTYAKTLTNELSGKFSSLDDMISGAHQSKEMTISRGSKDHAALVKLKGNVRYSTGRFFISHPTPDMIHIMYLGPKPSLI